MQNVSTVIRKPWKPSPAKQAWMALAHEVHLLVENEAEGTVVSGTGATCHPVNIALDRFADTLPFEGMKVVLDLCGTYGYALLKGVERNDPLGMRLGGETVSMQLGSMRRRTWNMEWLQLAERVLSRVEAANWTGMPGWEGLAARKEVRRWGADPSSEGHVIEPLMTPLVLEAERMGWKPRFSCEGHPTRSEPATGYLSVLVPTDGVARAQEVLKSAGFRVETFEEYSHGLEMAGYSPRFHTRSARDTFMRGAWETMHRMADNHCAVAV